MSEQQPVYPRSTASADPTLGDAVTRVRCEVYSRVVGYLRPVSSWHDAKQQEMRDRVTYDPEKTHIRRQKMRRG